MSNFHPQVAVAQIGARRHYDVPVALHRAGLLSHFFTDVYSGPGSWLYPILRAVPRCFQNPGLQRLRERRGDIPKDRITAFNRFALKINSASRGKTALERINKNLQMADAFQGAIIRRGLNGAEAVYCFDTAALELFRQAGSQGIYRVLEQCCVPRRVERGLLAENNRLWPGWEEVSLTPAGLEPLVQRETAEWDLADLILAPSEFVAQALQVSGVSREKVAVVPYGFAIKPITFATSDQPYIQNGDKYLRILFVGEVGLRKGIPYLLDAIKRLKGNSIQTKIVGGIQIKERYLSPYSDYVDFVGHVPRSEVQNYYQWADVFVLPSTYEGSAGVIYEALSFGLPVITTPHAGSVVRDGLDGYIVPIRDAEALAERIETLLKNRDLLLWMSQNARENSKNFTLIRYSVKLCETIINQYFNK